MFRDGVCFSIVDGVCIYVSVLGGGKVHRLYASLSGRQVTRWCVHVSVSGERFSVVYVSVSHGKVHSWCVYMSVSGQRFISGICMFQCRRNGSQMVCACFSVRGRFADGGYFSMNGGGWGGGSQMVYCSVL